MDIDPRINQLPASLKKFLEIIQSEIPVLLGDTLNGIYIYGSISYGDFDEERSDVDVIAIIYRTLSAEECRILKSWHKGGTLKDDPWLKRLEMDYVGIDCIVKDAPNMIKTARFSGMLFKEEAFLYGHVIDLVNIRECGISLYGPPGSQLIPDFSRELLRGALRSKYQHIKDHAEEWSKDSLWGQVLTVLLLCRVVYTLNHEGKSASKKDASYWCITHVPNRFRKIVELAHSRITDTEGPKDSTITKGLPDFVNYIGRFFE